MKNASLFFDFFKSFFQRKGKSDRDLKKNSIKREKQRGAGPRVAPCRRHLCRKMGQSDSFLHISGRKKSRSLGEGNGPLSQSAADTVQRSRKTSGENLFIYYIKPLTGQTADRPLPRANARTEQRGCRCIREALQRSMCSNRFCECAPDQRTKADRPF